jgi:hypothetical protein
VVDAPGGEAEGFAHGMVVAHVAAEEMLERLRRRNASNSCGGSESGQHPVLEDPNIPSSAIKIVTILVLDIRVGQQKRYP